jgi:hypothetical protein
MALMASLMASLDIKLVCVPQPSRLDPAACQGVARNTQFYKFLYADKYTSLYPLFFMLIPC